MSSDVSQRFRFGAFELDLGAYQLRKEGRAVRLERRPMELLILLVQRAGQLVTREEIVAQLWGDKVVIDFDTGLNTVIRKVRHALGDAPDQPTFIETVPGKGYRFIAALQMAAPAGASDSVKDTPRSEAAREHGRGATRPPRLLTLALVVGVLLIASAAWVWRSSISSSRVTIAVLPFDNISANRDYDYLADGLAEDTIASLGQIDPANLQVVGPTSTFAYKRGGKPLSAMGSELGADYAVHSTLRVEGGGLRVTSSLIRVQDQVQLWTARFDRELTSMLGLQSDLSAAIAEQVRVRVSPERVAALDHRHTADPEAYDLYLRGRYYWSQLTPAGNRAALEHYGRAIERDANYALAWAGTALVLGAAPVNSDADPARVMDRARDAARRAIEQAPSLAEAQFAQGYVQFWLEPNWNSAETHLRRAIAIDPNNALAHLMLAHVLSQKGEHVEARTIARRARELDPLFPMSYALSSQVAFQARDYAAAVEYARQAIAINPEFWIGHIQLGQVQEQLGAAEEALQAFRNAERYSGGNSKTLAMQGHLLAREGRREEALAIFGRLEAAAGERYVPPYAFALVHAGLGDADAAFRELERGLQAGDVHLAFVPVDPKWDHLRDDPRFADLIERCGFFD